MRNHLKSIVRGCLYATLVLGAGLDIVGCNTPAAVVNPQPMYGTPETRPVAPPPRVVVPGSRFMTPNPGAFVSPPGGIVTGRRYVAPIPRYAPGTTTARAATPAQIVHIAQAVSGVRSAAVVVTGGTALVGIRLQANVPAQNYQTIANTIRNRVLTSAHGIATVLVTTDLGLTARLQSIATDQSRGQPAIRFNAAISQLRTQMSASFRAR